MAEVVITMENFKDEVLEAKEPVLLDFWATWCGPCQLLSPILAEIAEEREGKLKIGKVNVDEQAELANVFEVENIPTMVLMYQGIAERGTVGYMPKEAILDFIDGKQEAKEE